MAKTKRPEPEDVAMDRIIQAMVPCAGDFRAVINERGEASFARVAVWAHVTQKVGRHSEEIVVGMIAPDRTTSGQTDGALVFADEEPGFMGYCAPNDSEDAWKKICHDNPDANQGDDDPDVDDDEDGR